MTVPPPSAASSHRSILPPAISMRVPVVSSADRVSSSRRETLAMDGSASPRKPSVALEGQQRVVAQHAAAIVDDADQAAPAGFHFDPDLSGARIQRILEQFLDDGSGPFLQLILCRAASRERRPFC